MLIVSPPKEKENFIEQQTTQSANLLDFNDLDIDYLEEDLLTEGDWEFTELDINYLDVNFLEDMLNVLDALEVAKQEDALQDAGAVKIVGTTFGQDKDTQITTFMTGEILTLQRNVSDSTRIDIDKAGSYTIIFVQDGVSRVITINGGSNSSIKISQGS